MCTGPHTFQHLYVLDSGEDVGEMKLWCMFGNIKICDLDFPDDAVIFAETLKVLNEELEPLGLWVSWVKTKIQAFTDI